MFFFLTVSHGGGGGGGGGGNESSNDNFVVIAPKTMESDASIMLDVFYTMARKRTDASLLLHNYGVITCIVADA